MRKPKSLRKAITEALPDTKINPQQFIVITETGNVRGYGTDDYSFEHRYTLRIFMLSFTGDLAVLSATILYWLRTNQPELVAAKGRGTGQAFGFDVDILDNKAVDLEISIDLTENVRAVRNDDGSFAMEYVPEPENPFTEFDTSPVRRLGSPGDFE